MLSPKARAFLVDQLLGNLEKSAQPSSPVASSKRYRPFEEATCSIQTVRDDTNQRTIQVELCHSDLWRSFHGLGTEMIITKSGRRMFPSVRVRLLDVCADRKYRVYLDFLPVDHQKYRYVYHSSKWMASGSGESFTSGQRYIHPDSPASGQHIMNQVISFEKIKLTNSECPKPGQISLVSMQKFIPRIHVDLLDDDLQTEAHFVTSFPQTEFIAVTAYQNQEITRLKIARNPFAKGFRESGKNRSSLEAMMSSLHNLQNFGGLSRKRHMQDADIPSKISKPTTPHFVSGYNSCNSFVNPPSLDSIPSHIHSCHVSSRCSLCHPFHDVPQGGEITLPWCWNCPAALFPHWECPGTSVKVLESSPNCFYSTSTRNLEYYREKEHQNWSPHIKSEPCYETEENLKL